MQGGCLGVALNMCNIHSATCTLHCMHALKNIHVGTRSLHVPLYMLAIQSIPDTHHVSTVHVHVYMYTSHEF